LSCSKESFSKELVEVLNLGVGLAVPRASQPSTVLEHSTITDEILTSSPTPPLPPKKQQNTAPPQLSPSNTSNTPSQDVHPALRISKSSDTPSTTAENPTPSKPPNSLEKSTDWVVVSPPAPSGRLMSVDDATVKLSFTSINEASNPLVLPDSVDLIILCFSLTDSNAFKYMESLKKSSPSVFNKPVVLLASNKSVRAETEQAIPPEQCQKFCTKIGGTLYQEMDVFFASSSVIDDLLVKITLIIYSASSNSSSWFSFGKRETKSLPKVLPYTQPAPNTISPAPAPASTAITQQQGPSQTQSPPPSAQPSNSNQPTAPAQTATTAVQQPPMDPLHAHIKKLMVIIITKQLRNIDLPTIDEAIDAGSLGTIAFAVSDVTVGELNLTTDTLQATSNGPIIELKLINLTASLKEFRWAYEKISGFPKVKDSGKGKAHISNMNIGVTIKVCDQWIIVMDVRVTIGTFDLKLSGSAASVLYNFILKKLNKTIKENLMKVIAQRIVHVLNNLGGPDDVL